MGSRNNVLRLARLSASSGIRRLNDGLELMRFRNVILGFEALPLRVKGKNLARTVRSHRFNFYNCVGGHGTRQLALVIEKELEARRHIGFKDGDPVGRRTARNRYFDALRISIFETLMVSPFTSPVSLTV